jgi:hypothetical protein
VLPLWFLMAPSAMALFRREAPDGWLYVPREPYHFCGITSSPFFRGFQNCQHSTKHTFKFPCWWIWLNGNSQPTENKVNLRQTSLLYFNIYRLTYLHTPSYVRMSLSVSISLRPNLWLTQPNDPQRQHDGAVVADRWGLRANTTQHSPGRCSCRFSEAVFVSLLCWPGCRLTHGPL